MSIWGTTEELSRCLTWCVSSFQDDWSSKINGTDSKQTAPSESWGRRAARRSQGGLSCPASGQVRSVHGETETQENALKNLKNRGLLKNCKCHKQELFIEAFCRQIKWWALSCTWCRYLMLTVQVQDTKKKKKAEWWADSRWEETSSWDKVKTYRHICRQHILHTEHYSSFYDWLIPRWVCAAQPVDRVWNDESSSLTEFHKVKQVHHIFKNTEDVMERRKHRLTGKQSSSVQEAEA